MLRQDSQVSLPLSVSVSVTFIYLPPSCQIHPIHPIRPWNNLRPNMLSQWCTSILRVGVSGIIVIVVIIICPCPHAPCQRQCHSLIWQCQCHDRATRPCTTTNNCCSIDDTTASSPLPSILVVHLSFTQFIACAAVLSACNHWCLAVALPSSIRSSILGFVTGLDSDLNE